MAAPSKVSDDVIRALMEKGLSYAEIGRQVGLTRSTVQQRAKAIRERSEEHSNARLPWRIRDAHSAGWVYTAVVGYRKMRNGEGVTDRERRGARDFEEEMHRANMVIGYDYNKGFYVRMRRPEDGPSMLVKD